VLKLENENLVLEPVSRNLSLVCGHAHLNFSLDLCIDVVTSVLHHFFAHKKLLNLSWRHNRSRATWQESCSMLWVVTSLWHSYRQ